MESTNDFNRNFERTTPFAYDAQSKTWIASPAIIMPCTLISGQVFRIISWNIDFMEPFQPERVAAALTYLQHFLRDKTEPTIILLQEILGSSLDTLLTSQWVKENFQISHVQPKGHPIYFTITLIPRDIQAVSVFRVPLAMTYFGRDGLFVDLPVSRSSMATGNVSVLRVCNTHLESLQSGNDIRPLQLAQISSFLQPSRSPGLEVIAGLVGGDMNAICPNDDNLHRQPEINLHDAFEVLQKDKASLRDGGGDGGDDEDEDEGLLGEQEGHTWGYQPRCQFLPGRLDKIYFTGRLRPAVVRGEPCVTRLGVGLKVQIREDEEEEGGEGEGEEKEEDATTRVADVWVTDHFGITTTFKVLNGEEEGEEEEEN